MKNAALDVLFNREEDSEIRIKAYLALVDCPCSKIANKISELLETEPVNQGKVIQTNKNLLKIIFWAKMNFFCSWNIHYISPLQSPY